MATFTLRRSDLYPVGTTVGAYPATSGRRQQDMAPAGAATESQAVAADGTASFVALAADTDYLFYANVGGQHRVTRARTKQATGPTSVRAALGQATGTATTTSGSQALTVVSPTAGEFRIGQRISGAGIPAGTTLISGSGASWTLSQKATASAAGVPVTAEGGTAWPARLRARRVAIGTS